MVTIVHESAWPKDAEEERGGAPYVVLLAETCVELSRHATAEAALEAARAEGPGAAVWSADDLAHLGGRPLAEVRED